MLQKRVTYDEFNTFCASLPQATHVEQWGGAQVWKVCGKVFAIGGWADDVPAYTFKTNALDFEILKQMPGVRGAPYFASRGMTWIQSYKAPGLSDAQLKSHIKASYQMIVDKLPKKKREILNSTN